MNLSLRGVFFGATVAVCADPGAAAAAQYDCGVENGESPYAINCAATHEHGRYASAEREIVKQFGAYLSSFDGNDDDDGDGEADLLAVPHWVSYELNGVEASADVRYREPPVSIEESRRWYRTPEFEFLWTDRDGGTVAGLDASYLGAGHVWNRGHLAMSDHVQRMGWKEACNTYHFWTPFRRHGR